MQDKPHIYFSVKLAELSRRVNDFFDNINEHENHRESCVERLKQILAQVKNQRPGNFMDDFTKASGKTKSVVDNIVNEMWADGGLARINDDLKSFENELESSKEKIEAGAYSQLLRGSGRVRDNISGRNGNSTMAFQAAVIRLHAKIDDALDDLKHKTAARSVAMAAVAKTTVPVPAAKKILQKQSS